MKTFQPIFLFALLGAVLGLSAPAGAGDVGRYAVVPLETGDAVFILDTRDGHVWTWTGNPRVETKKFMGIIYQGRVHPADVVGKVIEPRQAK